MRIFSSSSGVGGYLLSARDENIVKVKIIGSAYIILFMIVYFYIKSNDAVAIFM